MFGAIIGDVVGSVYEWNNIKRTDFPLFVEGSFFTDDTVMTVAVAAGLLSLGNDELGDDERVRTVIREAMVDYGRRYPDSGYGSRFRDWLFGEDHLPYNSYGNGSAMRVSPVAYFAKDLKDALRLARLSAEVTHNHVEGIRGAEAVAGCIYLSLSGASKADIRSFVEKDYYSLDFSLDDIRDTYSFDVSCQGSVPIALEAFLEGDSFESVVRLAISVGGDSDTIAAIAGSIGESFFCIADVLKEEVISRLDTPLLAVVETFYKRFSIVDIC